MLLHPAPPVAYFYSATPAWNYTAVDKLERIKLAVVGQYGYRGLYYAPPMAADAKRFSQAERQDVTIVLGPDIAELIAEMAKKAR